MRSGRIGERITMTYRNFAILSLIVAGGCVPQGDQFTVTQKEGVYSYTSSAQKTFPSPFGEEEASRLHEIEKFMNKGSSCADNYEIAYRGVQEITRGQKRENTGYFNVAYNMECK